MAEETDASGEGRDVEPGVEAQFAPEPAVEAQKSLSERRETPIPELVDAFEGLRREEYGTPIALGQGERGGTPSADTQFIGHIIPSETSADSLSAKRDVVIFDTGDAMVISNKGGQVPDYDASYRGIGSLYFPHGMGRADVFSLMLASASDGGVLSFSTNQPHRKADITREIEIAGNKAKIAIEQRRTTRKEVGKAAANAFGAALNPDSRPPQG